MEQILLLTSQNWLSSKEDMNINIYDIEESDKRYERNADRLP